MHTLCEAASNNLWYTHISRAAKPTPRRSISTRDGQADPAHNKVGDGVSL